MELGVVAAVLGAAFLHAFWNFMVRRADDKALGMASVMIGHVPLAVLALLWMVAAAGQRPLCADECGAACWL